MTAHYTLGISAFAHDASCALLKNGEIRSMAEEERFNREKHTMAFPEQSIRFCLEFEGISIKEVNEIAFFWKPLREVTGNFSHFFSYFPSSLHLLGDGSPGKMKFLERISYMRHVGQSLQSVFGLTSAPQVHFIEHHLCHAASAFLLSPFEEAAILTIDGRGESTSTMLSRGKGTKIEKVHEIAVPHSVGHFYAAITDYLGFTPFFEEWKVMGMSAYGTDRYVKDFANLIGSGNGFYQLNLKYFRFHTHGQNSWLSQEFYARFGPARGRGNPYCQDDYDIAFALQRTVEAIGVAVAVKLRELTGSRNLCLAGGVVLNCLMNREIVRKSGFEKFFFQPVANDAGTSLGAALYQYFRAGEFRKRQELTHLYFGPEFSADMIEAALRRGGVPFRKSANIAADTAACIAAGKIVGWFQGRMESGPRALGNRSIVVDPTRAEMKDRLNAKVKRREGFRPFAPSVLAEKCAEYFDLPKGLLSPHMMLIGEVRADKRSRIPAVTHADGTARIQTVTEAENPRYYTLLKEFEKISGVPVLLNTSFNENEPIVCTPDEAVRCFLRTDFDVLAIGDYLVEKP